VGIGEHPQQVEEAMKGLEKLANANDKIDNLKLHFNKTRETL
jgi:F0F1-type ATP synthase gamma subunit